jgi:uncharacterized phage protein gp47/JayE
MKYYLQLIRPNVDTTPGSFTRDVIIDAPAQELSLLYSSMLAVSNAQSPDLASTGDIERLAANYQITRRGSNRATGQVTFFAFTAPETTITIPQGTTVVTKGLADGTTQQYLTTREATLSAFNFNAYTGRYEVVVAISAVQPGTVANVGAGTITAVVSKIAGIDGVFNASAITSGMDYESISAFRARIKKALLGNNVGTENGYVNTLLSQENVLDVLVAARGTGYESIGRSDVGTVDIFVRGDVPVQAPSETYVVPASGPFRYSVAKQPIDFTALSEISVSGVISGDIPRYDATATTPQAVYYNVAKSESIYKGSYKSDDAFVFIGVTPGETITIRYTYNSLITSLQGFIQGASQRIVGTDLLIKSAEPRKIDVTCTVQIDPAYTEEQVLNNVTTAFDQLMAGYLIGQQVQQSDIIAAINNAVGVNDVLSPLTYLAENIDTGTLVQNTDGNIDIPANSYAVAGTLTMLTRL